MQILVLGMHRSGTSTVARILNLMGCYFGSKEVDIGAAEDNPKGFWERRDVVRLNDRILALWGGSWWDVASLDYASVEDDELQDIHRRIEKLILKLDAHRPWFVKDPRMAVTLDYWLPALELPVFIYVSRSPEHVSLSLERRNGMPVQYGLALWEFYTRSIFQSMGMQDRPPVVVKYEELLCSPYEASLGLYNTLLEAGVSGLKPPVHKEVESFVDQGLCHFKKEGTMDLTADQISLMTSLQRGNFTDIKLDKDLLLFKTLYDLRKGGITSQY